MCLLLETVSSLSLGRLDVLRRNIGQPIKGTIDFYHVLKDIFVVPVNF